MPGDERFTRCLPHGDPAALNYHYLRQLILVASHGDDTARRRFVATHRSILGGYAAYLLHLSESLLREAFDDALSARQGAWPETLMGFRLAVPARPPQRRGNMWKAWEEVVEFQPAAIAFDPVCGMFVDPEATPFRLRDGSRIVYFCCPRCLTSYTPEHLELGDSSGRSDPLTSSRLPVGA